MFKDMELPAKNFLMFAADEFKGIEELKTEDVAKICVIVHSLLRKQVM